MKKEKKRIIQKSSLSDLLGNWIVNSSIKNKRIPKKEEVEKKFEIFVRVNSVQVVHEGASFVDIRGTLE